jgi:hypothetical protein
MSHAPFLLIENYIKENFQFAKDSRTYKIKAKGQIERVRSFHNGSVRTALSLLHIMRSASRQMQQTRHYAVSMKCDGQDLKKYTMHLNRKNM